MNNTCPCGTEKLYENCCECFHLGKENPPSAESLMRSRYTAYVVKNENYLLETWHKSKRPKTLNLKDQNINWLGLKILRIEAGAKNDDIGKVEFIAEFKISSKHGKLHEISNFVKENSKWFYVDGKIINDE